MREAATSSGLSWRVVAIIATMSLLLFIGCQGRTSPRPTVADIPDVSEVACIEIGMREPFRRPVNDRAIIARCIKELKGLAFAPPGDDVDARAPDEFILKNDNGTALLALTVIDRRHIRFRTRAGIVKACKYEEIPTFGKLYSMNEWLDHRQWIEQYTKPGAWDRENAAWWIEQMNRFYTKAPFPVPDSPEELEAALQKFPVPGTADIDHFVDYFTQID